MTAAPENLNLASGRIVCARCGEIHTATWWSTAAGVIGSMVTIPGGWTTICPECAAKAAPDTLHPWGPPDKIGGVTTDCELCFAGDGDPRCLRCGRSVGGYDVCGCGGLRRFGPCTATAVPWSVADELAACLAAYQIAANGGPTVHDLSARAVKALNAHRKTKP